MLGERFLDIAKRMLFTIFEMLQKRQKTILIKRYRHQGDRSWSDGQQNTAQTRCRWLGRLVILLNPGSVGRAIWNVQAWRHVLALSCLDMRRTCEDLTQGGTC